MYFVKIDVRAGTVTRRRAGLQFQENERPMQILSWDPENRVLAFKVPAHSHVTLFNNDYSPAEIEVCLVSPKVDKEGEAFAMTLCKWEHRRGAYKNHNKYRSRP
jgi:hypothetical protein